MARGVNELVDGLNHVDGNADGPRLVGDGARDGLPNPPGSVSRELVSAAVLEFFDRAHEADVALLNYVEKLQTAIVITLGDAHDQAQVGPDQFAFGGLSFIIGFGNDFQGAPQLGRGGAVALLDL